MQPATIEKTQTKVRRADVYIISSVKNNIEEIFNELYIKWREETRFDSFIGNPDHNCYDEIVKLGRDVIPYIIDKLREEPSLIFMPLVRITGKNPVKEENKGIIKKMTEDWIQWWEKEGNA